MGSLNSSGQDFQLVVALRSENITLSASIEASRRMPSLPGSPKSLVAGVSIQAMSFTILNVRIVARIVLDLIFYYIPGRCQRSGSPIRIPFQERFRVGPTATPPHAIEASTSTYLYQRHHDR